MRIVTDVGLVRTQLLVLEKCLNDSFSNPIFLFFLFENHKMNKNQLSEKYNCMLYEMN